MRGRCKRRRRNVERRDVRVKRSDEGRRVRESEVRRVGCSGRIRESFV